MEEADVDETVIEGSARSTGRHKSSVPRPIRFRRYWHHATRRRRQAAGSAYSVPAWQRASAPNRTRCSQPV